MKLGRNDECPCGSGKKFKYCCKDRKIEKTFINLDDAIQNFRIIQKQKHIKQCIY